MSITSKWIVCATCMEAIKEIHMLAGNRQDALYKFRDVFPVNENWRIVATCADDQPSLGWVDGYRCDIGGYNYNS